VSSTQFFNGTPTDSSAQSNDAVTPRVGILWQPKSWLSLYANYVESFGPSLVNGSVALLSDHKPAPPTTAEQYEGGIKTEFFGGRLRATLAYFDLTKTNIATPIPGNTFNFYRLTGAARTRGPELDFQGEILPGWNVIATYTNTDAIITKSDNGDQGNRFFNISRNAGSLWSTYEVQDGDLRGLKVGGGVPCVTDK
jgi:iron complex outermembrane recepter protein